MTLASPRPQTSVMKPNAPWSDSRPSTAALTVAAKTPRDPAGTGTVVRVVRLLSAAIARNLLRSKVSVR